MPSSHTPLKGKKRQQATELLLTVTDILDSNNIPYHLEGGTLLGLARDGQLIPWDTDIDISICSDRFPAAISALKQLKKSRWRVKTRAMKENGICWNADSPRIIKIKNRHPYLPVLPGDLCLDIFIKYSDKQYTYWKAGEHIMRVKRAFYQGFDTVTFMNRELKTPCHYQQYLSLKYGNWKTPQQNWHFSNEGTIIK